MNNKYTYSLMISMIAISSHQLLQLFEESVIVFGIGFIWQIEWTRLSQRNRSSVHPTLLAYFVECVRAVSGGGERDRIASLWLLSLHCVFRFSHPSILDTSFCSSRFLYWNLFHFCFPKYTSRVVIRSIINWANPDLW